MNNSLYYNKFIKKTFCCISAHDSPETIELEINTSSSEGLILWQGVVSLSLVFRRTNSTGPLFQILKQILMHSPLQLSYSP